MNIGIDIQHIPKFKKALERHPTKEAIFALEELSESDTKSLCGIFAAKEALVKIGLIKAGDWSKIKVLKSTDGEPLVYKNGVMLQTIKVSISHSGQYCVAVAVHT